MRHRRSQEASSPACRFRGASARVMPIWGAIISSGPAISAKPEARCSRAARTARSAESFVISGRPRRETDRGGKIIGWTARPIGAACSSTSARSPCCSWTWPGATARLGPRTSHSSGRWSSAPRASSCAPDQEPSKTVAALLAAAEIAEACDIENVPALLRDTADAWNEQIEDWIYVEDTPLAREAGVPGYYIRVAPESTAKGGPDVHGLIQVRNHEAGSGAIAANQLISTDAIALVRFG